MKKTPIPKLISKKKIKECKELPPMNQIIRRQFFCEMLMVYITAA